MRKNPEPIPLENKKNSGVHNPGEKYKNKKISVSGSDPKHSPGLVRNTVRDWSKTQSGTGQIPPDVAQVEVLQFCPLRPRA